MVPAAGAVPSSRFKVLRFEFARRCHSRFHLSMRITGGKAARRIIKAPKGLAVRPTPDLVKQAIFNSLGARVAGSRVLELFAGTGALSLECLSRGAINAVCVENSTRHAEVLRQNFQIAGFANESLHVRAQDVFAAITQMAASGETYYPIPPG